MHLPESGDFLAKVSFVCGCDAATDYQLLDGLSVWIARRLATPPNYVWWGQLLHARFPEDGPHPRPLPPDVDSELTAQMWVLLSEFLAERDAVFTLGR
jgi:hypothetical protein